MLHSPNLSTTSNQEILNVIVSPNKKTAKKTSVLPKTASAGILASTRSAPITPPERYGNSVETIKCIAERPHAENMSNEKPRH